MVSMCSMCFMPISTAFLMFCVWPSTLQSGGVAFFDDGAQLVVGDRQVHLDVIDAGLRQAPHVGARLGDVLHVAAIRRRRAQPGPVTRAPDTNSRGPLILSALQRLALRDAPGGVVVNVGDRRDAVRQEHRQLVVAQVHVAVDEAGKNRPAVEPDDGGVRRIRRPALSRRRP